MNVLVDRNDRDDRSDPAPTLGPAEAAFAISVARTYVRDPDDAADVAQDALLLAHRHRDSFRGESRYRTWLYRIVATTALSHLRRRRRRPLTEIAPGPDDPDALDPLARIPSSDPSAEARLADAQEAEVARRQLDRMGAAYSRVFRMRFEEDRSEAEVARALGLSVPTVKIRTHRARRFLQKELVPLLRAA